MDEVQTDRFDAALALLVDLLYDRDNHDAKHRASEAAPDVRLIVVALLTELGHATVSHIANENQCAYEDAVAAVLTVVRSTIETGLGASQADEPRTRPPFDPVGDREG